MILRNFTAHTLVYQPPGEVAHELQSEALAIDELGRVQGRRLPDPEPDTVFLVSREVAEAAMDRSDLRFPSDPKLNPDGSLTFTSLTAPQVQRIPTLPDHAFDPDGPIFVSYRSTDGLHLTDHVDRFLRAAGLRPWRDLRHLGSGDIRTRLDQALTSGLSGAVVVVTDDIQQSAVVKECELPRILELHHAAPEASVAIANAVRTSEGGMDFEAPDRLLETDASVLQRMKQYDIFDGHDQGVVQLVTTMLEEHLGRRSTRRPPDAPLIIDVQTRVPGHHRGSADLSIRLDRDVIHRYPSAESLRALSQMIEPMSNKVTLSRPRTIRFTGSMHLSVAMALGATFTAERPSDDCMDAPVVECVQKGTLWSSRDEDARHERSLVFSRDHNREGHHEATEKMAFFVTLSPYPHMRPFAELVETQGPFDIAERISLGAAPTIPVSDESEPTYLLTADEGPSIAKAVADRIRDVARDHTCHVAFQGPQSVALLMARHLNTTDLVVYELDDVPRHYVPVMRLRPGGSLIDDVLLSPDTPDVTPQERMRWVKIESGSNQDFIFRSPRRRYNVGASALVRQVGRWAKEYERSPARIVVATSATALILVQSRSDGDELIERMTTRALVDAPGMDLWGYCESDEDVAQSDDLGARLAGLHLRHAQERSNRPTPHRRAQRLPFSQACAYTGLAAAGTRAAPEPDRTEAVSLQAMAVLDAGKNRYRELKATWGAAIPDEKKEDVSNAGWTAIVHADGNGIGDLLSTVADVDAYAQISLALERATLSALNAAINAQDAEGWILPLIVGGDDVTVIVDARRALSFTQEYLRAFELATTGEHVLAEAARRALGRSYLTASAGVLTTHVRASFGSAYDLVSEVTESAKRLKSIAPGVSCLDFHVLRDSIPSTLEVPRSRTAAMPLSGGGSVEVKLHGGPYVVPHCEELAGTEPLPDGHMTSTALLDVVDQLRSETGPITITRLVKLRDELIGGAVTDVTRLKVCNETAAGSAFWDTFATLGDRTTFIDINDARAMAVGAAAGDRERGATT